MRVCMHVHCIFESFLGYVPNSFAFFLNVFHLLIGEITSKQILASFVFYPGVVIVIVIYRTS